MDAALHELDEMAAKLQETARKLTPGPSRQAFLQEIGRFRVQLSTMRQEVRSGTARPES
jgi:hypothetical protein